MIGFFWLFCRWGVCWRCCVHCWRVFVFQSNPQHWNSSHDAHISIQKSFKFSYSCAYVFSPAVLTKYQYHHSILPAFPEYERAVLCVCRTVPLWFLSYKQHLPVKASLLKFYFVGQTAGLMHTFVCCVWYTFFLTFYDSIILFYIFCNLSYPILYFLLAWSTDILLRNLLFIPLFYFPFFL